MCRIKIVLNRMFIMVGRRFGIFRQENKDGSIIFRWIFRKWEGVVGTG